MDDFWVENVNYTVSNPMSVESLKEIYCSEVVPSSFKGSVKKLFKPDGNLNLDVFPSRTAAFFVSIKGSPGAYAWELQDSSRDSATREIVQDLVRSGR